MRAVLRIAIAGLCALAAVGAGAQAVGPLVPGGGQAPPVGDVKVKEVNVVEIDSSHVKLAVDLNLTAKQSATLEDARLCSLRLNGLPVFAAPLNQEIVLKKGTATTLPPLYITVLTRDLHSVEPLRRMIEKQSVLIEGEMVAGVRLNLVEKMALHTQHPKVEMALSQEVPAEVGGSALERQMALAILAVVESSLQAASGPDSTVERYVPGIRPAWVRVLETSAAGNLYAVESNYSLSQAGVSYPVVSVTLGYRLGPSIVVTSAEASMPWKYDAEFLSAVQSGAAKLVKNSQDILLRPIGQGATLRLGAKDFAVEMRGVPEEDALIAGPAHTRIQMLRRAATSSLALLNLHAPEPGPGLVAAPASVAGKESWDQIAVFRLRVDPTTMQRSVEVLQMGARRLGQAIRLNDPVDSAVYGSPIVTPDGVIGVVQDEETGAFLPPELMSPAPAAGNGH